MFKKLYEKLDIPYVPRTRNYAFEKTYRKDVTYELLTKKWLSNSKEMRGRLYEFACVAEVGAGGAMETQHRAFRAYVFALKKLWSAAAKELYEIIRLEGGENVDSWIDLGHFLRKISKFEYASLCILLNPEKTVQLYRSEGEGLEFKEFLRKIETTTPNEPFPGNDNR